MEVLPSTINATSSFNEAFPDNIHNVHVEYFYIGHNKKGKFMRFQN